MFRMIYPKLWVAAVPKYWSQEIPSDYPTDTGSEFSLNYDSKEVRLAVQDMESKLATEESIITDEMIPENMILGNYLGTYNVTGVAAEKILLSPKAVSSGAVQALAFHYVENTEESTEEETPVEGEEGVDTQAETEESTTTTPVEDTETASTSTWVQIKDAEIVDGYVYGTVDSFSPIAVFEIKRDSYLDTSHTILKNDVYVGNGIPLKVYTNDEGKTVVEDANGKITEIAANASVLGGTLDGSSVESTSVSVNGVKQLYAVWGGSYCGEEGKISKNENVVVKIMDSTITSGVVGCGINNRIENVDITIRNSTVNFTGAGESYDQINKKDTNADFLDNLGLDCNTWVKNCKFTIENSDIWLAYASGNSGYLYVDHSEIIAKDSTLDYLIAAGSNGGTNECEVSAENCTIQVFSTTNRGFVRASGGEFKNCTINVCAVCGDPTDGSVDGTIDSVKLDFTGGKINLYAGTNGGEAIDAEAAKEIVQYVKIGRETEVTYMDKADQILKDVIRLK